MTKTWDARTDLAQQALAAMAHDAKSQNMIADAEELDTEMLTDWAAEEDGE